MDSIFNSNKRSNNFEHTVNNSNDILILKKFKNIILKSLSKFLSDSISIETKKWINEKLNDRLEEVYDAYSITEKKYKYRERDSWEMYMTHINWVLDIYINKLFNLDSKLDKLDCTNEDDRKKAIELIKNEISIIATCIEHDSIEDTDWTMEWINERFTNNKLVAFTTLMLSKKPFYQYINTDNDKKEFEEIKITWILNEKWLISDRVKKKIKIKEDLVEEIVKFTMVDDHLLTEKEKNWLERYSKLEKKYKDIRNKDYFNHYKSKDALIDYAEKLLEEKWLTYSKNDFETIIHNTIIIKLADRTHNLKDIAIAWINTPKRIENKLIETEIYLLTLAKEFNIDIYQYMMEEISKIRKTITINWTKNKVEEILK